VHNGIEYADMQMIAEIYGLMRDGQGRDATDIGALSSRDGTTGALESYLIEIAAEVSAATEDPETGASDSRCHRRPRGAEGDRALDRDRRAAARPRRCRRSRRRSPRACCRARRRSSGGRGAAALPRRRQAPCRRSTTPIWRRRCWSGKILAYSQGFTLLARARVEEGLEHAA
jgi:6-phosphogluconate dehydrogenase